MTLVFFEKAGYVPHRHFPCFRIQNKLMCFLGLSGPRLTPHLKHL